MKTNLILLILLLALFKQGYTQCKKNYYRDAGTGQCIACESGRFSAAGSTSRSDCKSCEVLGCQNCDGVGKCTKCVDGYYGENDICKPCEDEVCLKCSGPLKGKCEKCYASLYLDKDSGTCKNCGENKGSLASDIPDDPSDCFDCKDANCLVCAKSGLNSCVACPEGYGVVGDGNWDNQYQFGWYWIGSCQRCKDSVCLSCDGDLSRCNYCAWGYQMDLKGKCESCSDLQTGCLSCNGFPLVSCNNCAEGYFLKDNQLCVLCDAGCKGCTGTGQGKCDSCKDGYYMKDSLCVPCSDTNCKVCPGEDACTSCARGFYVSDGKCKACDEAGCIDCSGAGTNKCFACGDKYYLNGKTCSACQDSNCLKCSGGGAETCSKCEANYYLNSKKSCTFCGIGKYSAAGATDCKSCEDTNCEACSGAGKGVCTSCADGYYLSNGKCVVCDAGCLLCSGTGANKCSSCDNNGYYFSEDSKICEACGSGCHICSGSENCSECLADNYLDLKTCKSCAVGQYSALGSTAETDCHECEDDNCNACSGSGTGVCTTCEAYYYLDTTTKTCKPCGVGQYSAAGATKCSDCADENCNSCDGPGINQCSVCSANSYLESGTKTCTSCPSGYFSESGSTSGQNCASCGNTDCLRCSGSSCTTCRSGYTPMTFGYRTCSECLGENCATCDRNNRKMCWTCPVGYQLASDGNCKEFKGSTTIQISSTIRYDMDMEDYTAEGGDTNFMKQLSLKSGISESRVKITKSSGGSSLAVSQEELEQIKAKLDDAVKTGALNMYPGAIILNYKSGVVVVTGTEEVDCPSGQYRDSSTNICKRKAEIEEKKSNMGLIIGCALGGVALIGVIIVVIYYKRGAFSRSSSRAKYKKTLAHSPPISPRSSSRGKTTRRR